MQPAIVPESLIAERHRRGLDKKDEMWDGVLHMNEPGSFEHQRVEIDLAFALRPAVDTAGLRVLVEAGVFDPAVPDYKDFRTPDAVVFAAGAASERGIEGQAALVIEVRSQGDESFEKIPFYGRVGVQEMLIIDRDTKAVRRWTNAGGALVEQDPAADGWHRLGVLAVEMKGDGGKLLVRGEGRVDEI